MPSEWKCGPATNRRGSLKVGMYIINAVFIYISAVLTYHVSSIISVLPTTYISYMYSMAAIICICGILGLVATYTENVNVYKAYAVILLAAVIIQVIRLCYLHQFNESIKESTRTIVKDKWLEEIEHPGAMDNLQTKFECCGNDSSNDYVILHRPEMPSSCHFYSNITRSQVLSKVGCFIGIGESIQNSFITRTQANWGNMLLTSALFVLAIYLVIKITNKKRRDGFDK